MLKIMKFGLGQKRNGNYSVGYLLLLNNNNSR